MPFLSRSLLAMGGVLLVHACYSAHEHSSLTQALTLSSPDKLRSAAAAAIAGDDPSTPYPSFSAPMTSPLTSLPLDITLETLISVLLLCVALVLGAEELKPISWRVWAGKLQRGEGKKGEGEGFAALDKGRRRGFVDIRGQRKEFANWAKGMEVGGGK